MASADTDVSQEMDKHLKPSHLKLNEFCKDDEYCNVVLKTTDGDEINAHRCFLITQSEYFEKMFSGRFQESNQNVVRIKDISNGTMKHLLEFIYTDTLVALEEDTVEEILNGAEILQLNHVRSLCIEFLMMTLDHHNCFLYKEIADSRVISELQKECFEHALINFNVVSMCPSFLDVDITQLTELMKSDDLRVNNEENLYEAVIKWVKYDEIERKHEMPNLLSHIRLVFVSQDFLANTVNKEPLVMSSPECLEIVKKVVDHFNFEYGDSLSKLITNVKPRKNTQKITIGSSDLIIFECNTPGSACVDEHVIDLTAIWSTASNNRNLEWTFLMNEKNFLKRWDEEWEGVNKPDTQKHQCNDW